MAAVAEFKPLSFSHLRQGMTVRIVRVDARCEDALRLQEMGLTAGTTFAVLKVAPFGDPIEIDVRGYRLCLRKRETSCFELEAVSA